ncbi:MAG: GntR family transcriptional regulator [Actinomycetota bacterium]
MVDARLPVADTLGGQISEAIERDILRGILRPGQRLNADDIAQAFGVSRIPVREALRSLDAAGWVEIRPRHGAFVRERSPKELEDLFHVRSMLETDAAALAAARRDPAGIAEMDAARLEMQAASDAGDADAAGEANTRFHRAMALASGNEVLAALAEQLAKRIRWYFATVASTRSSHSAREHAAMVDAIRSGDGATAASLVREHVARTAELVQARLAEELEREGRSAG